MKTLTKVQPITDELTSLGAMSDADHEEHDDSRTAPTAETPPEETAIEYIPGCGGDTRELPVASEAYPTPVVADSSVGSGLSLVQTPQPQLRPPLLHRRASSITTPTSSTAKKLGHLKRTSTLQILASATQLTKAELKAKQNAEIERKAHPPSIHSLQDHAVYKVDTYISTRRGQTVSLAGLGLVLMVIGAGILAASQPGRRFHEMMWESWTFLGDSGSHTALTETGLRTVGVLMTLTGILYFSVIMGFVVDGIRDKMDSLKKGKSKVVEDQHTLMLGWTDKSIMLIRQLCLANASAKGGVVVVLAEREKEELEAELASQLPLHEMRGTTVIFRTGSPMLSVDLLKVAAHCARSIIIMAQTSGDADRSDANVLRTVLGLKTLPELSGHIVAELRDIDNEPLVRLVGGEDVEVLVSHDIIGRLVLMAARSPGLAKVFTCLLGFEGNEFYFKEWPECTGVAFGALMERFPDAIPLGIKRRNGDVLIAPPSNVVLERGDQLMVLAEDDDTYKAHAPVAFHSGDLPSIVPKARLNEKILMCGWRRDIRDMIQLLDSIVLPQTELHMVCEEPCHLRNKVLAESGLNVDALQNLRILHHFGNTAIRRHMEPLPLHTFTSMLVLADSSREDDIMHSDSHTLASLLLMRDLQSKMILKAGRVLQVEESCRCICEVLDPRTQRTISTSDTILKLSEFIQSNEIVSCMLAMVSESREVRAILDELLGVGGASFEIEPSTTYCTATESVSFWQVAKRAMSLDELVCGFQKRGAVDETVLNPSNKAVPRTWRDVDFIVLRQTNNEPVVHPLAPQPVQAEHFERTTQNRMSKSSMTRQHILEALVQEQDSAHLEHARTNGNQQHGMSDVQPFVGGDRSSETETVRALVTVTRLLAEHLRRYESGRSGPLRSLRVSGPMRG